MMGFTAAEGVVFLKLGGLGGFNAGMSGVQRTLSSVGRGLSTVSRTARNVFIGLAASVGGLVALAGQQELAEAKVSGAVRATGKAAGFTTEQLKALATALQDVTTFGDEAIMSAMAILLTFKQIKGDEFKQVTEAVLDMATLLGSKPQQAAIQFGKALNDPILGVSALNEAGIQFTETQKRIIKNFVETNQLAKAQRLILDEIKGQMGGIARAAADTPTGAILQFKNNLSDLAQTLGGVLLPELGRLAKGFSGFRVPIKAWILANAELIKSITLWTAALSASIFVLAGVAAAAITAAASLLLVSAAGVTVSGVGAGIVAVGAIIVFTLGAIVAAIGAVSISSQLEAKFDLSGLLIRVPVFFQALRDSFLLGLSTIGNAIVAAGKLYVNAWKTTFTLIFDAVKIGIGAIVEAIKTRSTEPIKKAFKDIGEVSAETLSESLKRGFKDAGELGAGFVNSAAVIKGRLERNLATLPKVSGELGAESGDTFAESLTKALAQGLLKGKNALAALKALFPKLELPDEIPIPKGAGGVLGVDIEANLRPSLVGLEAVSRNLQTAGTKRVNVAEQQLTEQQKTTAATGRVEQAVKNQKPAPVLG